MPSGRRAVLRLAAALGATATVGVLAADRLAAPDRPSGAAPCPGAPREPVPGPSREPRVRPPVRGEGRPPEPERVPPPADDRLRAPGVPARAAARAAAALPQRVRGRPLDGADLRRRARPRYTPASSTPCAATTAGRCSSSAARWPSRTRTCCGGWPTRDTSSATTPGPTPDPQAAALPHPRRAGLHQRGRRTGPRHGPALVPRPLRGLEPALLRDRRRTRHGAARLDRRHPGLDGARRRLHRPPRARRRGPGVVVLNHDAGGDRSQSVAALRRYLPRLLDAGYHLTVPRR